MASPINVLGLVEIVGKRDRLIASIAKRQSSPNALSFMPSSKVAPNRSRFDEGPCRCESPATGLSRCDRSVRRPRGRGIGKLGDGFHNPVPDSRSAVVASECEFRSSSSALLERLITVAHEHQLRRSPNINLRDHGDTVYGRRR